MDSGNRKGSKGKAKIAERLLADQGHVVRRKGAFGLFKAAYFSTRILPLVICMLLAGCAGRRPLRAPIKWVDPDTMPIPQPKEIEENQIWDIVDKTFIHQVGKVLDLGWSARRVGRLLGIAGPVQAHNVNALDEVPNSSWFTRRHYWHRMTFEELQAGPNETEGPDTSGVWTIVSGKFEGGTAGFTIEDSKGDRYLLKFDAFGWPEMGSAAEVIATKIFYAAGYNVPQNTIVYFDASVLAIGEKAKVAGPDKIKRRMSESDLHSILSKVNKTPDGRLRAMASKFLPGRPIGVFNYLGRRKDDANDRVDHEHRRELRGMRMISAWLNDADRRAANTLNMYTEQHYVRHYLIDFGSTLGSNNLFPHAAKYGYEYLWDPRTIARSYATLGLWQRPWLDAYEVEYRSVGYIESEIFDPVSWVPTYPNPAFEKMTLRDAFWGAKIVMSFTDEDLRTILTTARLSNPAAEAFLLDQLIRRRDKVGRAVFTRINPLDKFQIVDGPVGAAVLSFADLSVDAGFIPSSNRRYRYRRYWNGEPLGDWQEAGRPKIELLSDPTMVAGHSVDDGAPPQSALRIEIQSSIIGGSGWSKRVDVFIGYDRGEGRPRIVGLEREE